MALLNNEKAVHIDYRIFCVGVTNLVFEDGPAPLRPYYHSVSAFVTALLLFRLTELNTTMPHNRTETPISFSLFFSLILVKGQCFFLNKNEPLI